MSNKYKNIRFPTIFERVKSLKEKNTSLKINPQDFICNISPSEMKETLNIRTTDFFRKSLEPVGADLQCKKAIEQFKENTTPCWICGCVINGSKACEHILPVVRAIMLKGIITSKQISEKVFKSADKKLLTEATKQNYLWAHADCNIAKSGTVLIKFDESNVVVPDKSKCDILEKKILTLHQNCHGKKNPKNTIFKMMETVLTSICDPINNEITEFKNFLPNHDTPEVLNKYVEYLKQIILLYLSSEALDSMLSKEEIEQKEIDEIEKMRKEQDKLLEDTKESYRSYYGYLLEKNKSNIYVNLSNGEKIPLKEEEISSIININLISFLSKRTNNFDIYEINNKLTDDLIPIMKNLFSIENIKITYGLYYAVINYHFYEKFLKFMKKPKDRIKLDIELKNENLTDYLLDILLKYKIFNGHNIIDDSNIQEYKDFFKKIDITIDKSEILKLQKIQTKNIIDAPVDTHSEILNLSEMEKNAEYIERDDEIEGLTRNVSYDIEKQRSMLEDRIERIKVKKSNFTNELNKFLKDKKIKKNIKQMTKKNLNDINSFIMANPLFSSIGGRKTKRRKKRILSSIKKRGK